MTDILGIDPGESPGYCWRHDGRIAYLDSEPPSVGEFDIAAVEGQFQAPRGKASRNGKKLRVNSKAPLSLALTAGMQLAEPRAKLKLVMAPPVWRGLLWSDGGGLYGLSQEATLNRLRELLPPERQGASPDQIMAFGLALAAELVGFNKKGTLRNGTPWKLLKQPGRFEVVVEKPLAKARAFVKGLGL